MNREEKIKLLAQLTSGKLNAREQLSKRIFIVFKRDDGALRCDDKDLDPELYKKYCDSPNIQVITISKAKRSEEAVNTDNLMLD